jgi:hypothetical protein
MKKGRKWHYRVKSWVIFNKGQFTHICQLNVSYGQESVSGIVVQALLSFFDTIPADSLKIYFSYFLPLLLIKVDFYSDFTLNKYSLRAYLHSFPTTHNT